MHNFSDKHDIQHLIPTDIGQEIQLSASENSHYRTPVVAANPAVSYSTPHLVDDNNRGDEMGFNEICRGDGRSDDISGRESPMTRGARDQLQRMDAPTMRRLGNRAGAARLRRRRMELVRETEAAVVQSDAQNAALRAQLAAALRFIEQLGYSVPAATLSDLQAQPLAFHS